MSQWMTIADAVTEWRWVDDKGRAMTDWKVGPPFPPVMDLQDERGTMHVEVCVNRARNAPPEGGQE